MKKVGLLCGREWSWPPKFLEEVNRRNAGVTAEFVKLGGTRMDEPSSLPLSEGMTRPIALAAPVEVGISDKAAARAR